MKAIFWARSPFAEAEIAHGLSSIPGVDLYVERSIDGVIGRMAEASFLCLTDPPLEDARRIVLMLSQQECAVRAIHFSSVGREGFTAAGLPHHIVVTGPGDALSPTVAEHAIAATLALMRQLPNAIAAQARGSWAPQSRGLATLNGAKVLLVGYGNIGKAIASRLTGFGCQIFVASRTSVQEGNLVWVPFSKLDQLVPDADVVIASVALAEETRNLFDRRLLQAFKTGAILVNVGRGGLIDTAALIDALDNGPLGGAALDVTEPEPLPERHPLFDAPNLLLTAHYAGASPGGAGRLAEAARRSLEACVGRETSGR